MKKSILIGLYFGHSEAQRDESLQVVVKEKTIRECGMFKFYAGRFLGGVKEFESEYPVATVQVKSTSIQLFNTGGVRSFD